MNVLFHLVAGFGIAIAVCTEVAKPKIFLTATAGVFIAFVSHALLDYTPHCYPINSKVDFIAGFILLFALIFFARKEYKVIMLVTLTGAVLPDIIDLLPAILNKQLHLKLPVYNKVFPWHWKNYSGSIYNGNCSTSHLNTAMICFATGIIMLVRWNTIKTIYALRR
ncbi:MAG: hypothetical protein JNM21_08610 [Taibaiella sp.]|nr:hypothetical protein [Taibaiella sp.]